MAYGEPMNALGKARSASRHRIVVALLDRVPGRFSRELGLDLAKPQDVFLWFLAAILFGARISGALAVRTFREFVSRGLVTPERIVRQGWDGLVDVLDAGGYARYDFKTASKLLEVMQNLLRHYEGDLSALHEAARDARDVERRLKALGKGIGDTTVQIFLRELRDYWAKADPPLSPLAELAARHLGLLDDKRRTETPLPALTRCWKASGRTDCTFSDFEAALVRVGRDYCRRHRQTQCPMREFCGARPVPDDLFGNGVGRSQARSSGGSR